MKLLFIGGHRIGATHLKIARLADDLACDDWAWLDTAELNRSTSTKSADRQVASADIIVALTKCIPTTAWKHFHAASLRASVPCVDLGRGGIRSETVRAILERTHQSSRLAA